VDKKQTASGLVTVLVICAMLSRHCFCGKLWYL